MRTAAQGTAIANAATLMHRLHARGVSGAALRDHTQALLRLMRHNFGDRRWDEAEVVEAIDRWSEMRAAERVAAGTARFG